MLETNWIGTKIELHMSHDLIGSNSKNQMIKISINSIWNKLVLPFYNTDNALLVPVISVRIKRHFCILEAISSCKPLPIGTNLKNMQWIRPLEWLKYIYILHKWWKNQELKISVIPIIIKIHLCIRMTKAWATLSYKLL